MADHNRRISDGNEDLKDHDILLVIRGDVGYIKKGLEGHLAEHKATKDRWRAWFMKIGGGIILAGVLGVTAWFGKLRR